MTIVNTKADRISEQMTEPQQSPQINESQNTLKKRKHRQTVAR